jgi:hypothetical protein
LIIYPLIGADYKPLYYSDGIYTGFNGRILTIVDGYLNDGGFIVHSIVENLISGEQLYIFYMADKKTFCPLYGNPRLNSLGQWDFVTVDFTYLNGLAIDINDFIIPEIDYSSILEKNPEIGHSFFDDLLEVLKSFWQKSQNIILIVLAILVALMLIPLILPLIVSFFKAIFGAISGGIRAITGLFKK